MLEEELEVILVCNFFGEVCKEMLGICKWMYLVLNFVEFFN